VKTLLLLGGGHAHIEVLRLLGEQPVEGWKVVLASPFARQLYSGMVPGVVAGHYALEDCAIDLRALCRASKATFQQAAASLIDPARREVTLADAGSIRYDLLSMNIGGRTVIGDAGGVERNAIVIRPLESAMAAWEKVLERARKGEVRSVTLVGAGAAGLELALAMHHRFAGIDPHPHVRVLGDRPALAEVPAGARERLLRIARERNVGVHGGHAATEVGADYVQIEGGLQFASDATFWTTGTAAPGVIRDSGLATDARGFLLVNDYLQSTSHPQVFGAGDCAVQEGRERPRAGVFAVRAAPALAANLRAVMAGGSLAPHRTGRNYLALVSAGNRRAVGFWNGFSWEGDWAWRWKDRIDRRFVAKYA
jgi:pyridine nucleotide-disulfide oxidoreductase family protein